MARRHLVIASTGVAAYVLGVGCGIILGLLTLGLVLTILFGVVADIAFAIIGIVW